MFYYRDKPDAFVLSGIRDLMIFIFKKLKFVEEWLKTDKSVKLRTKRGILDEYMFD